MRVSVFASVCVCVCVCVSGFTVPGLHHILYQIAPLSSADTQHEIVGSASW